MIGIERVRLSVVFINQKIIKYKKHYEDIKQKYAKF